MEAIYFNHRGIDCMINHLYDIFRKWSYTDGKNKNSIWVFSDPHFGDAESRALRGEGFPDDAEVVRRINSKVGRKDTIIFLGDIGDIEYVRKVRGYKVLIMGNHDKGASNYKKEIYRDVKWGTEFPENLSYDDILRLGYKEVEATPAGFVFEKVTNNGLFDEVYEGPLVVSEKVILSHEPIQGIPFMFNVHGHVHNKDFKGDETHLNVCAEAIDCTPINLISFIAGGGLGKVAGIHRETIDYATKRKAKRHKGVV